MSILRSISKKAEYLASPLLILFAFSFPLSTSAGSVTAMLVILAWILSGNFRQKFHEIGRNPVAIAVLCYIALNAAGLIWTDDMYWGIKILKKQWKLLLFPIFLTIVRREHVTYYLFAFIAAIFLIASKAYLAWLGLITLPPGSVFTTVGTSHVIYNPMLALAIYILVQKLIFLKNSRSEIYLLIFLIFYLSCNMFITVGRTGQIAFFVLLIVLLFQAFYKTSKKKLLVGLLLIPLLIAAIFQFSPTFKNRITLAITEIQEMKTQAFTSVGCRVWFVQNSYKILEGNRIIGIGTGDFPMEYAKINKTYSPLMPTTNNPHNQYLLTTVLFGVLGLSILLAIFACQLLYSRKQKDDLSYLRLAFPIFFMLIMLAESYLLVHATGLLFSLFSAFLYKDFRNQKSDREILIQT
jgi:O-antigen ligase